MNTLKSKIIFALFIFTSASCSNPAEGLHSQLVKPNTLSDAEQLFQSKCTLCHNEQKNTAQQAIKAASPDMFQITEAIYQQFDDSIKGFDRDGAKNFIINYVLNPDETKSILLKQKAHRFGLMPSLKGSVTERDLEKIADLIFDKYPPEIINNQYLVSE